MNKIKKIDCVEYQHRIRMQNYIDANGDYDVMISNQKKRLKNDSLWKELLRKKLQKQN